MFAKLANKNTMVLGQYRKSQNDNRSGAIDSVNADILDNNAAILNNVTLMDGSSLNVVRMPMPANSDNNFRTYVNSQFINGVNLIPVYRNDDRFQDEAMAIWQQVMPDWSHVDIDATELITWAGAVHCILMEVSEGVRAKFQASPSTICNDFDCAPNLVQFRPQASPLSRSRSQSRSRNLNQKITQAAPQPRAARAVKPPTAMAIVHHPIGWPMATATTAPTLITELPSTSAVKRSIMIGVTASQLAKAAPPMKS